MLSHINEGQIPLEISEMKLEQQINAKIAQGLQNYQLCISHLEFYYESHLYWPRELF